MSFEAAFEAKGLAAFHVRRSLFRPWPQITDSLITPHHPPPLVTLTVALAPTLRYMSRMIDYMQKGGPLMWLILLCSAVTVAVFVERLLYFHRANINLGEFLQGLANLIRSRNLTEARIECQTTSVPVTRVIYAALSRPHLSRSELREIVEEAGQIEVPRLERNLDLLVGIAYVSPLIGLLGTVTGLIQAFVQLSASNGYATLADVSSGVYQSLLTTAASLAVAIPTILAYCLLSSKLNALMHEMERAGIEIVNVRQTPRRLLPSSSSIRRLKQPAKRDEAGTSGPAQSLSSVYCPPGRSRLPVAATVRGQLDLSVHPGISVNLPYSKFTLGTVGNSVNLTVTAGPFPRIYYRYEAVTLDELRKAFEKDPVTDKSIIIRADRDAPQGSVVQVMNLCLDRGYSVILATSPKSP